MESSLAAEHRGPCAASPRRLPPVLPHRARPLSPVLLLPNSRSVSRGSLPRPAFRRTSPPMKHALSSRWKAPYTGPTARWPGVSKLSLRRLPATLIRAAVVWLAVSRLATALPSCTRLKWQNGGEDEGTARACRLEAAATGTSTTSTHYPFTHRRQLLYFDGQLLRRAHARQQPGHKRLGQHLLDRGVGVGRAVGEGSGCGGCGGVRQAPQATSCKPPQFARLIVVVWQLQLDGRPQRGRQRGLAPASAHRRRVHPASEWAARARAPAA